MANLPKAVKIKRDGVVYISNVDRVKYTIHELIRAALRDVGRLLVRRTRQNMDKAGIKRRKGRMKRNTQYWVRKRQRVPNLQVGYKPGGFYAAFYELGTSEHPRHAMLQNATKSEIDTIQDISGKYLSAIEDERRALSLIDDDEYLGGD